MTTANPSTPFADRMPTSRVRIQSSTRLLLAPALLLLVAVFLVPLAYFFIQTLGSVGSPARIVAQMGRTLTSGVFVNALMFTLVIAVSVTFTCLVIAYPLSYCLLIANRLTFTILMGCVVLPYFVSTIVRTYAWMVLLGRTGVVNNILINSGLLTDPLNLMYNAPAIIVGMVYVLLPYIVLTLYSSMKSVDKSFMRAAEGMGAPARYIFRRIFFPLTLPGVISGSLIIFILSLGFFITPALMGGPRNVTVAMLVEREVEINMNWAMASTVSLFLLVVTLILYGFYYRFSRIDKMFS